MNYEDIINKHGNLFLKFYRENDEILYNYGVESFAEVKKRIQNLLDEMVEKYPDENLLFVTHLDPIKAVISLLLDLKPEALFKLHIRNAALTIIKQEGEMLSLSGVNIMGIQSIYGRIIVILINCNLNSRFFIFATFCYKVMGEYNHCLLQIITIRCKNLKLHNAK